MPLEVASMGDVSCGQSGNPQARPQPLDVALLPEIRRAASVFLSSVSTRLE